MIIKFQIIKALVVEAVKANTYLKGKIDQAADSKATKVSYEEIAGDDEIHENTLTRDFDTALEVLKTFFVDYLVPTPQTVGDNAIYYSDKTDGIVEFVLSVSRRYNGTLTDALARLSARYIEDYMTYQWWLKTTNLKQAEPYQATLSVDEQAIRKCFVMSGPTVPSVPYTTTLTTKVDGSETSGGVYLTLDDDNVTLSYSIDNGAIDDIEARSSDPSILGIQRSTKPYCFLLNPVNTGVVTVKLFSRHSDSIAREVEITVAKEVAND